MKRPWNIGNGWSRRQTKRGFRYFHKGKPTSGKKFQSAIKRIDKRRKEKNLHDTNELRKSLKLKPIKKTIRTNKKPGRRKTPHTESPAGFTLCKLKDRREFYEKIKADRRQIFKTIEEEQQTDLRIVIDIDPKSFRKKNFKKNRKRGFQNVNDFKERGHRSFANLRKLKNFLGLNTGEGISPFGNSGQSEDNPGGLTNQFWTKSGICHLEKRGYMTLRETRGQRITGEKILRRYKFNL